MLESDVVHAEGVECLCPCLQNALQSGGVGRTVFQKLELGPQTFGNEMPKRVLPTGTDYHMASKNKHRIDIAAKWTYSLIGRRC